MSELSKQQLSVENSNSFPNNNGGLITPAVLRAFNNDMIDSTVNQIAFNAFSSSVESEFASLTQSVDPSITGSSLVTASFDNDTRNLTFTKGDATTFNVNIPDVSGSILPSGLLSSSVTNFFDYSASVDARILAITGSSIDTGSFATTGSNTFTGNQIISGNVVPLDNFGGELGSNDKKWTRVYTNEINGLSNLSLDAARFSNSDLPLGFIQARQLFANGVDGPDVALYYATSSSDVNSLRQVAYVASGSGNNPDLGQVSASFASTIAGIVTGTGFATTGSNTFVGQQVINSNNAITISGSGFGFGITLQGQQGISLQGSGGPRIQLPNATFMQGGQGEDFQFTADTDNPLTRGLDFFLYGSGSRNMKFRNNSGTGATMQFQTTTGTGGDSIQFSSISGGIQLSAGQNIQITGSALQLQGFTYPTTDGTNGQVLTTNGSKTLSFTTVSGGGIDTGSLATTGSNTFIGNQNITGALLQSSSLPNEFTRIQIANSNKDFFGEANTLLSLVGDSAGILDFYADGGNFDTLNIAVTQNSGTAFRDWTGAALNNWLLIPTNTGNNPAPQFQRGLGITGSLNVSADITASLAQGFVLVGDSNNKTSLVATSSFGGGTIDTGSLATTGSNTFIGNQVITGSIIVSGSDATNTLGRNIIQLRQGSALKTEMGSLFGGYFAAFNSDGGEVSMIGDASAFATGWAQGPAISLNDPTDSFPAVIGFQNKTNWTDGRVAILTPLSASAGFTASLQNGYVWVGNSLGQNTQVTTSSFIDTFDSSSLATTGSNTFNGNQVITGSLKVRGDIDSTNNQQNFIVGRTTIFGGKGDDGQTPRLFISGSDGAFTELGRGFTLINTVEQPGLEALSSIYASTGSKASLYVGVFDQPSFNTDVEFAVQVDTGSGIMFKDWDNGSTFNYVTWLSVEPNTGNNPAPQFKRSVGITGSLSIQSGSGDLFVHGNKQFNGAQYSSLVTQSGSANVSQSVTFNTTGPEFGVSLVDNTKLTVANSGTYNIQFSAQLLADTGADNVFIWFKKNGTNIAGSASELVIQNNDEALMTVNILDTAAASDFYELCWQSTNGDAVLLAATASGNIPSIPSVITTITQVR